jgi:alpha-L-rhamnosidase
MKLLHLLTLPLALLMSDAHAAGASPGGVTGLTCEGLVAPALVDTAAPRFSWRLVSPERGARQTAYQLRIGPLQAAGAAAAPVETPRLDTDQSQWVTVPGFVAQPRTRYQWQVRIWDEHGREQGWSEPAVFATGLLGEKWPAPWVADGVSVPRGAAPAARYFRHDFTAPEGTVQARLFLSAAGIVEPWLNGAKVTADHFLPGWPDYQKRLFYVSYDVTAQVRPGANALGLILGDGWYSGTLLNDAQSGSMPAVSAFVELTDAAGKKTVVTTGKETRWANGPVTAQGIYHGEDHDARLAEAGWCQPGAASRWQWQPVQLQGARPVAMTARLSPPVRAIEEIRPVNFKEIKPGVWLYDLGQNMVGWPRLNVSLPAGSEVRLRFAEMLEKDGTLHTANLRKARASATYRARGDAVEKWEPQFTFFGFRYVEVTGVPQPTADTITGVVVHTDLPRIGHFECSNPLLNRLYANTLWGQKGNFLEVPTDCPQRDERLGWTGDAQVFAHTASYNYASGNFYRQWLAAVRDSYRDDPGGDVGFGDVAPDGGFRRGSAGWGDAAVIIPWVTWLHTGDRRILEENIGAIQTWVEAQTRDHPDGIRRSRRSYGDWLAPGFKPREAPTPYELIATAYMGHVTALAARIADILGNGEAATRHRARFELIRTAFARAYLAADGRIKSDEQTAYLLALGFDLVPPGQRAQTLAHLERKFTESGGHLATGFLGTPLITPVLSAHGRTDLAYAIVLKETYPGWLFSVKNGATTIWERWDSWTPDKGFNPEGMNSFNHYAYGSVVGWFYDTVAGLRPDETAPGWKRLHIAPEPGGGLTQARASLETPYGRAVSSWLLQGGRYEHAITVPPNTEARVSLLAPSLGAVTESGQPLAGLREAKDQAAAEGRVRFTLAAGSYVFVVSPR